MITQHLFLYTLYGLREHFLIFSYISSRVLLFYLWHCRLVVDGTHVWLLELVESRWKVGLNTVIWFSMNVFYLAHHTERNNLSDYFQLKVAVMLVFSHPLILHSIFKGLSFRTVLCMINSLRSGYPGNRLGDRDLRAQGFLGSAFRATPTREGWNKITQRKKLYCDVVRTEADSVGSCGAAVTLQTCPEFRRGGWTFVPSTDQSLNVGVPGTEVQWGWGSPCEWGQFLSRGLFCECSVANKSWQLRK